MKTWLYLLEQDLFENNDFLLMRAKKAPTVVRKNMLKTFKESSLTVSDIKSIYLKPKDYQGKKIDTWEQLLDLEIYRFTPIVIKGNNKKSDQIELNELIPFKPKVIRNTI